MPEFEPGTSGVKSIEIESAEHLYGQKCTAPNQCDQKKFAKCLIKLPKNDFTRKMTDFDNFIKIA